MSQMFRGSKFNQNISEWDVSKTNVMSYMFALSVFNQALSKWDVSSVENMEGMFSDSEFNQKISNWDVSSVINMLGMFRESAFNQDISKWKPKKLIYKGEIFNGSKLEHSNTLPYWANVEVEFLEQAINAYELQNKLNLFLYKPLATKLSNSNNAKL